LLKLGFEIDRAHEPVAARCAFGAPHQEPHIGDLVDDLECMGAPRGVRPRLDVEADRGRADDEKDRKTYPENDTLRQHQAILIFARVRSVGPSATVKQDGVIASPAVLSLHVLGYRLLAPAVNLRKSCAIRD